MPRRGALPTGTCAASARRRCRSCCACDDRAARGARALAAGARLRRASRWRSSPRCAQGSGARQRRHVERAAKSTEQFLPFAYLLTALLFARSGLYAERAQRPGLSRIVGSLFQVAFVALIFARRQRRTLLQLLPLLRLARLRALLRVRAARRLRAADAACCCAPPATSAGRCSSGTRQAHRATSPTRSRDAPHAPIEVVGFISRAPLPDNGLRSLGSLARPRRACSPRERIDEVIIADPDFPQVEAVELVDQCHQRGVRVRLAPSTMEILIHRAEFVPGQSVPLFELGPPVFEGIDFALKRTFDIVGATLLLVAAQPAAGRDRARRAPHLARPGPVTARCAAGIGQRPFACLKFRTMHTDAEERQADLEELNEADGRAVQDPRRPAPDARSGACCGASRSTSCRSWSTCCAARCRSSARGRCPSATTTMLEDWHRKRYLVLPGHHRAVAGLGPLGARLRRPRAPRLPLPRALVAGARPDDPAEDDPGRLLAARRVLSRRGAFAQLRPFERDRFTQIHGQRGYAFERISRTPVGDSAGRA